LDDRSAVNPEIKAKVSKRQAPKTHEILCAWWWPSFSSASLSSFVHHFVNL
jgi:hypothetical protein